MKSASFLLPAILAIALLISSCDDDGPPSAAITLERTVCFGACPDYTVSIGEDGSVVFIGRQYVKVKDTVRSNIFPAAAARLAQEFDSAGFFTLYDRYVPGENCGNAATDMPSQTLTMERNGTKKTVTVYWGCELSADLRDRLTRLGNAVDSVAQTKQWIE